MSSFRNRNLSELTFDRKGDSSGFILPEVVSPTLRDKMMGARLGPGAYNTSLSTLSGPSFVFSLSTRFKEQDKLEAFKFLTRKSSYQGFHLPEINFESFRPSLKLSRIREEADSLTNKLATVKTTKRKIDLIRKEKVLKKIQEKNEKYEIRKKIKEFRPLASKVFVMVSIYSLCFYCNFIKEKIKNHRLKIGKFVRVLGYICLMIGKMRRLLKGIRIIKAYRTLDLAVGRMKVWIFKKKNRHKSLISAAIDQYLRKPFIYVLARKFFSVVVSAQTMWRNALRCKKNALKAKVKIYKSIEALVLAKLPGRNKYKAPKKVIIRELLKIRKSTLSDYNKEMQKHQRKCEMIERSYSKTALKVKCNYGLLYTKIPDLILPKKPGVNYTIKKKKFIELVHSLMHRRSLWDV